MKFPVIKMKMRNLLKNHKFHMTSDGLKGSSLNEGESKENGRVY